MTGAKKGMGWKHRRTVMWFRQRAGMRGSDLGCGKWLGPGKLCLWRCNWQVTAPVSGLLTPKTWLCQDLHPWAALGGDGDDERPVFAAPPSLYGPAVSVSPAEGTMCGLAVSSCMCPRPQRNTPHRICGGSGGFA